MEANLNLLQSLSWNEIIWSLMRRALRDYPGALEVPAGVWDTHEAGLFPMFGPLVDKWI